MPLEGKEQGQHCKPLRNKKKTLKEDVVSEGSNFLDCSEPFISYFQEIANYMVNHIDK